MSWAPGLDSQRGWKRFEGGKSTHYCIIRLELAVFGFPVLIDMISCHLPPEPIKPTLLWIHYPDLYRAACPHATVYLHIVIIIM